VRNPVRYELQKAVATVTLDDGKANALSSSMQRHINTALDAAEQDASKAVVIAGNQKLFCGGFDLSVFAAGDTVATLNMLTEGFNLSVRLLTFGKRNMSCRRVEPLTRGRSPVRPSQVRARFVQQLFARRCLGRPI
jgi:enoyl-CoA hydratase/carnithine racemase